MFCMGTFLVGLFIHLLMVCWDGDGGNGDGETGNQIGTWENYTIFYYFCHRE